MAKTGPKKKEIDWKTVEELCHIHCTQDEIASVIGVDLDTIGARCLEDNNLKFSEFYRQKKRLSPLFFYLISYSLIGSALIVCFSGEINFFSCR
jgi:hypothetical protein